MAKESEIQGVGQGEETDRYGEVSSNGSRGGCEELSEGPWGGCLCELV